MELTAPDGSSVDLTIIERQGRTARFATDVDTFERILDGGFLNTAGTQTERPFEPGLPVEIEAELSPAADDDGHTESWWATTATQPVELPDGLEGSLREGVSFAPPPWNAGLEAAWRTVSPEPLLDLVTGVFLDQEWEVERPEPDSTVVQIVVPDDVGQFDLYVRTIEDQQIVTVISIIRAEGVADRVPDVVELAARMNGVLSVGSFEADIDTGLLSFKVGIDVEGDRLSVNLVRQMVGHAIVAAQRALPLLEAVLAGDMTPRGAAARL
jgi:hypothetical protein